MKVQGTLSLEGVKLHVRIDAPDDQQTLYVTNVHPNCLVIPKERWRVEFLGLPKEIVEELHRRNIVFLGQLINENWTLGAHGLNEDMRQQIGEALRIFLDIALVFDLPPKYKLEQLFRPSASTDDEEAIESPNGGSGLDQDISVAGLLTYQEETLQKTKNVKTLGDILKMGRSRLLMTKGVDARAMDKIEVALRKYGLNLSDDPQTPAQSS